MWQVDQDEAQDESRLVSQVFVNPDCDPSTRPQYCILALLLQTEIDMDGDIYGKPKQVFFEFPEKVICYHNTHFSGEEAIWVIEPLI